MIARTSINGFADHYKERPTDEWPALWHTVLEKPYQFYLSDKAGNEVVKWYNVPIASFSCYFQHIKFGSWWWFLYELARKIVVNFLYAWGPSPACTNHQRSSREHRRAVFCSSVCPPRASRRDQRCSNHIPCRRPQLRRSKDRVARLSPYLFHLRRPRALVGAAIQHHV